MSVRRIQLSKRGSLASADRAFLFFGVWMAEEDRNQGVQMSPHVKTTREAGFIESIVGVHHFTTHVCKDGRGTDAVKAAGSTPGESRERALDKYAAKQAANLEKK